MLLPPALDNKLPPNLLDLVLKPLEVAVLALNHPPPPSAPPLLASRALVGLDLDNRNLQRASVPLLGNRPVPALALASLALDWADHKCNNLSNNSNNPVADSACPRCSQRSNKVWVLVSVALDPRVPLAVLRLHPRLVVVLALPPLEPSLPKPQALVSLLANRHNSSSSSPLGSAASAKWQVA